MARIGVTTGGLPAILPVNFALVGPYVVIRTIDLSFVSGRRFGR